MQIGTPIQPLIIVQEPLSYRILDAAGTPSRPRVLVREPLLIRVAFLAGKH